jgi:hypothetical protein
MMDDVNYYHSILIDSIGSLGIKISTVDNEVLLFNYNARMDTIKLKKFNNYYSNVILFNGKETPWVISPIETDSILEYVKTW